MKSLIQKLLRENLIDERVTINDTEKLGIIHLKEDNIFLLLDLKTGKPLGYISVAPTHGDVFVIYGAYSERGYGPLLYELAMTYVYPKGITMSDDSSTSEDAMNVWEKFMGRADVKKMPIKRTKKTDKEEWFDDMSRENPDMKNWIDRGRELHRTQFIYNLGKDKLDKLITKGNKFLQQHPDLDIMNMVYSLER